MKNVPMLSDHIRRPAADKFHDECAVVGVYGHKEAANLVYLGLYALQHRGQESSGIVATTAIRPPAPATSRTPSRS